MVVTVHGLEGSSESNYAIGIADKAYARGFHAVRLNQRNCGGTERLTPTLYNSGLSGDYRAVLLELIAEGFQKVFFVGYSMGGNLVAKLAGEFGEAAPKELRGVAAVCPAMDLAACADALERLENYLYERHFVEGIDGAVPEEGEALSGTVFAEWDWRRCGRCGNLTMPLRRRRLGIRMRDEYYEAAGAKKGDWGRARAAAADYGAG